MFIAFARSPESARQFFNQISQDWLSYLQDFINHDLPRLIVVLLTSWALIAIVNTLTRRLTALAEAHTTRGLARVSQIKTVSAVIRATTIAIISFLASLQVLAVFNFNLAPLLTSAGVAGVAIGLAAQTIVKDCLNGMLILIEDQYNVGDVVRLAGLSGTVESMSLRTTMLRDGDGTLYTIPNSQITSVANLTRDYSVANISVSVDLSADSGKVMAVLLDAAMSVRNDAAFSNIFLADPKLLGVDSIKGSQVIYMIQIRTLANQQAPVVREVQRQVLASLEENGILPGDPFRAITTASTNTASTARIAQGNQPGFQDPTASKSRETNPFTGEDN